MKIREISGFKIFLSVLIDRLHKLTRINEFHSFEISEIELKIVSQTEKSNDFLKNL